MRQKRAIFGAFASGLTLSMLAGLYQNQGTAIPCDSGTVDQRVLCALKEADNQYKKNLSVSGHQLIKHAVDRLGFGFSPQKSSLSAAVTSGQNAHSVVAVGIGREMAKKGQRSAELEALMKRNYLFAGQTQAQIFRMASSIGSLTSVLRIRIKDLEERGLPVPEEDRQALISLSSQANGLRSEAEAYLTHAKLASAAFGSMNWKKSDYSDLTDDQLNLGDVVTEFWFNHFNVEVKKVHYYTQNYERDIRLKSFTTFKDLLTAVMRNPAMLVYLDNQGNRSQKVGTGYFGSNQNLARELLELHTTGKGPVQVRKASDEYTQTDIEGVAQILTGWTTSTTPQVIDGVDSHFFFSAGYHVPASVVPKVMGVSYNQVGVEKGLALLKNLANLPKTKANICTKLALRLAGNHGQQYSAKEKKWVTVSHMNEIVSRCVAAWGVDGNLPAMYVSILSAPQFWHPARVAGTVKSPMELVVSAYRAVGTHPRDLDASKPGRAASKVMGDGRTIYLTFGKVLTAEMRSRVGIMGLSYREVVPPTGYSENRSTWLGPAYFVNATSVTHDIADHLDKIIFAAGSTVREGLKGFVAHAKFDELVDYSLSLNGGSTAKTASDVVLTDVFGNQVMASGYSTLSDFARKRIFNPVVLDKNDNLDLIRTTEVAVNCERKVGSGTIKGYCSSLRTAMGSYLSSQDFIKK